MNNFVKVKGNYKKEAKRKNMARENLKSKK